MLEAILRDAFAPRFQKMHDEINEEFRKFVADDHAEFVAALNNPAISTYIAFGVGAKSHIPHYREERYVNLCRPMWGYKTSPPDSLYEYHQLKHRLELRLSDDIKRPQFLSVFHSTTPDDYYKTWSDYTEAQAVLSALLNSYSTVEKLIVDFPEYAKYVPELPPTKNLPVVVVSEVRGKLTALGVPVE